MEKRKMNRKTLSLPLIALLFLLECVPLVSAHNAPFPLSYDPDHLVMDTVFEPETLDPAWANDVGSNEVIMNVYETLLFFDRNYRDGPYAAGKLDQFVPRLATSWTEQVIEETSPEGLTWVRRWTFTIRTNVKFHDGSTLTPEDVEYSFERLLVQDRVGGPAWMLYEPLLNVDRALPPGEGPGKDNSWGLKIDHAVESDLVTSTVWFNLVTAFPAVAFKQILSQTWSSVVERAFAINLGDLEVYRIPDGWSNWAQIWDIWHAPSLSFIEDHMMGTGPYMLDYWFHGNYWSIIKYDDYWDGWPAWKDEARTERIIGYISRVTWNLIVSWTTRRFRFLAGDTDLAYVDRQYRDQILGIEGFRSYYRWDGPEQPPPRIEPAKSAPSESGIQWGNINFSVPLMALDAFFFNFNIDPTSPWLGPGFNSNDPYVIAEDRIPINLFSDINVRLGFAYAFQYEPWLTAACKGEAERPSDPVVKGLSYDNLAQERYTTNLDLAAYYLMLAWGGALWENGMSFDVVWPAGNAGRETAAFMFVTLVNGLNSKFHINAQQVDWGSNFLPSMANRQLPLFVTGYQGNFLDPHAFVQPFMHSSGAFAGAQSYSNPTVDDLIKAGINTPDGPERQQIYYDLQTIYHNDVPSVPLCQPVGRQFEREWMRGWYYNPVYQGQYVYHRWKAKTHFGDADNDGVVGVADGAYLSAHWTKPSPGSPLGPLGYNPAADLTGGKGGLPDGGVGLVEGIPDGKVSVVDQCMVSAYWDGPPQGPSHPQ
jgi:peptide/nickel transport system substrate-binding protein